MKNLCLENYAVSTLENREMREISGGVAPLVIYGAIFAAGLIVGYIISK